MELISVIVPIYKVEKYLEQCLDSILKQSYNNLEIILVNDGSPDNCGKICDEYAKKDNRIKVIHKENGGLSSARNAGLDIATGEYISFIDSDDCVAENFIETLYKLCIENNCDISECDFLRFENEICTNKMKINVETHTSYEMQSRLDEYEFSVRGVVVWNKLYKKYLYQNIRFPVGKINEDEYTTYKVLYNCKTLICTTNQELYYYRINSNSIMGQNFNVRRLDVLLGLEEKMNFYKEKKYMDIYVKVVVRYQNLLNSFFISLSECNINLKNEKDIIIKKARKNYKIYKSCRDKNKIKNLIFILIPHFYYYLIKFKRRIWSGN